MPCAKHRNGNTARICEFNHSHRVGSSCYAFEQSYFGRPTSTISDRLMAGRSETGFCHAALGVGRFVAWCPETCPAPPLAPPSQGGNWCCAATQGWDVVPLRGMCWWGMCAMGSVERGSGASTSQLTLGRSPGGAAGGLCAARGTGWGGWGRSGRTRRSALPRRVVWAQGTGVLGEGVQRRAPPPPWPPPSQGGNWCGTATPGWADGRGIPVLVFTLGKQGLTSPQPPSDRYSGGAGPVLQRQRCRFWMHSP